MPEFEEEFELESPETSEEGEVELATEAEISAVKIPKEVKKHLNACAAMFEDRTSRYVERAMELHRKGPEALSEAVGLEIAEPLGMVFPPYPWWNLFLIGPWQPIGGPHTGPFQPSKVIVPGEPVYMFAGLWRNPAPINWAPGPSACQVMNGRRFQINFEVVNLTAVAEGPDQPPIRGIFPNAPRCTQWFPVRMDGFRMPNEGKPDLYQLFGTVDIVGFQQPMAGFANWILDLDQDPRWMIFPHIGPHLHYEAPVQFMCYRR